MIQIAGCILGACRQCGRCVPLPAEQLQTKASAYAQARAALVQRLLRRGLIAGRPDVQRRIAQELSKLGLLATPRNPAPRPPVYADLAKLQYMNAALRESLRLLPGSAVGPQRITSAPATDLGGYAVPARTEVLVRAPAHLLLETRLGLR